jgi:hypothetical protein
MQIENLLKEMVEKILEKVTMTFDESREKSVLKQPGETDKDYKERLAILRKEHEALLTDEEKRRLSKFFKSVSLPSS